MVAKKRKKSVKWGVAAKSKGSHGPKDTELADIGIRSSVRNMSKGTDRDVTKRKRAGKVLKEKQHMNEALFDVLPHFAMLIRKDRTVLAASRLARDAGAKVGGYCWRDFGRSDFIPEEDKRYINEHKKIPPGCTRCYFCLADETLKNQKPARNPELNAWGKIWDMYWIALDKETYLHYAIDITERKLAEQALKTQALVLENMAEGVNVCDENAVIVSTNPAFDRMFGYEQGELVGKEVWLLNALPPEENRRFVDSVLQHLKTHGHWSGEVHNQKKDGTYFSTRAVISKLESQGKIYWISVQADITERKEAAQALLEKNIALREVLDGIQEQKNEMGRTILSNVDKIIMPLIHVLEPGLPQGQQRYMDLLKQSLQEIASPFVSRLSTKGAGLTPTEMRICDLIRRGMSNKEIAQLEHISAATVDKHRTHIRRKLGIANKKVNLAAYLESFMFNQEES